MRHRSIYNLVLSYKNSKRETPRPGRVCPTASMFRNSHSGQFGHLWTFRFGDLVNKDGRKMTDIVRADNSLFTISPMRTFSLLAGQAAHPKNTQILEAWADITVPPAAHMTARTSLNDRPLSGLFNTNQTPPPGLSASRLEPICRADLPRGDRFARIYPPPWRCR